MLVASGGGSRWLVPWLGLLALLVYAGWLGAPYLHSIILRDAAVTSWISIAAAPIAGYVEAAPLHPGDRVGPDGRLLRIDNPRLDETPLARAEGDLAAAEVRLATAVARRDAVAAIVKARTAEAAAYGEALRRDIEADIAGLGDDIAFARQRVLLERTQADRSVQLAQRGTGSQAAADSASGRLTEHQRALTEMNALLTRATLRRGAAASGTLMLEDGTDAATAQRALEDARLLLADAAAEIAGARAAKDTARAVAAAAHDAAEKARDAVVEAPPGVLVWSLIAAPGAAVQPGSPVASWVDCRALLIDVPVSDVEIGLLHPGDAAEIVLEGEAAVRHGTVLLLRGSAATIGGIDLAAIAKGRRPGIGQALVGLSADAADVATCPIGHAAYVDFPGVGLIDVIRARLRL
jgi:multidrug resistance efflux pump